jgi:hypothetical protein
MEPDGCGQLAGKNARVAQQAAADVHNNRKQCEGAVHVPILFSRQQRISKAQQAVQYMHPPEWYRASHCDL